jgi:hypothetical protein
VNALKAMLREIFGLFVDDGSLAIAVLVWLALLRLLLPQLPVPAVWRGVILVAGLLGILLESALRRARQR